MGKAYYTDLFDVMSEDVYTQVYDYAVEAVSNAIQDAFTYSCVAHGTTLDDVFVSMMDAEFSFSELKESDSVAFDNVDELDGFLDLYENIRGELPEEISRIADGFRFDGSQDTRNRMAGSVFFDSSCRERLEFDTYLGSNEPSVQFIESLCAFHACDNLLGDRDFVADEIANILRLKFEVIEEAAKLAISE